MGFYVILDEHIFFCSCTCLETEVVLEYHCLILDGAGIMMSYYMRRNQITRCLDGVQCHCELPRTEYNY